MSCSSCGIPFDGEDDCYLREDDSVVCTGCHNELLREDADSGTRYRVRTLIGIRLPKSHPMRFLLLYGSGRPGWLDTAIEP